MVYACSTIISSNSATFLLKCDNLHVLQYDRFCKYRNQDSRLSTSTRVLLIFDRSADRARQARKHVVLLATLVFKRKDPSLKRAFRAYAFLQGKFDTNLVLPHPGTNESAVHTSIVGLDLLVQN